MVQEGEEGERAHEREGAESERARRVARLSLSLSQPRSRSARAPRPRAHLIDVRVAGRRPLLELGVREPQGDLAVGALDRVAAVDDVAGDRDAIVTADGARGAGERVGLADHQAAGGDGASALEHDGDHGARGEEVDELAKEGARAVLSVVSLSELLRGSEELEGDDLEAAALEAREQLADETALDGCEREERRAENGYESEGAARGREKGRVVCCVPSGLKAMKVFSVAMGAFGGQGISDERRREVRGRGGGEEEGGAGRRGPRWSRSHGLSAGLAGGRLLSGRLLGGRVLGGRLLSGSRLLGGRYNKEAAGYWVAGYWEAAGY